jgi:hypothetical protein
LRQVGKGSVLLVFLVLVDGQSYGLGIGFSCGLGCGFGLGLSGLGFLKYKPTDSKSFFILNCTFLREQKKN